jgi:hypothetical protein
VTVATQVLPCPSWCSGGQNEFDELTGATYHESPLVEVPGIGAVSLATMTGDDGRLLPAVIMLDQTEWTPAEALAAVERLRGVIVALIEQSHDCA